MAAATGTAFAQSTVTLYGIADLGLVSSTTKNAAGATTDKTSGMVSGVQSGSRWGIRGSEDLGGGMKANFNFESAIGANDGTGNNSFGRRSVVELEGGFGKLGLGRDYTPSFSLIGGTDVTGTDATTTSDLYPAGVRGDNMIMYTSPKFGGIVAKAGLISTKSGDPSATEKNNVFDLSLTYSAGPLMVGAAFGNQKANDAGAPETKSNHSVIGATYDLGAAKLFANIINTKDKPSNEKASETNLGVSVPMGAMTVMAGFGTDNSTNAAGVKSKGTDYVLGANYSLSKRTNLYARYNADQTAVVSGTEPVTTTMHFGVRHTF